MGWAIWAEMLEWFVHELKWSYGGDWILCRRLEWERSTVSSRVALLLRSAEVKLLFYRFVQLNCWILLFSFLSMYSLQGRFIWTCALVRACIDKENIREMRHLIIHFSFLKNWASKNWAYRLDMKDSNIHGHRTLKAPHPVRSAKLTRVPLS